MLYYVHMDTTKYVLSGVAILAVLGLGWAWWTYEGPGKGNEEEALPPPAGSVQGASAESAEILAQKDLALRLGVSQSAVAVKEVKETDWPDACLGLPDKEGACAQVIIPGLRITLEAGGKIYVYRANKTGSVLKLE